MPTIVERLDANADLFAAAVGAYAKVVPSLDELKQQLADDPDEYAIVLGPAVDLDSAAALADTLRVTRPATSVILVRRRVDTSVLAEALRSGMREVVEERDLTGLTEAVRRAKEVWEALNGPAVGGGDSQGGKQITVFSSKGGVGKTTLAVNLALALADGGQKKVALVDLDLAFGDVAITLQLFPARTIADTVSMGSGLDIGALETLMTPHKDNVSALVAPVQPDAKDTIPPALVGKILRLLKAEHDYVVVDTAPAFDEHVLQALDDSDEILLVTTLDVPTLKNVKIAVETLDLLNIPKSRRRLILNRADDKVGLTAEKVESTLGMKIAAAIPTSSQVANSTNAGEPIMVAFPRHPVSLAVASLARELASGDPGADAGQVSRPGSRKNTDSAPRRRGLLRRSGS